MQTPNHTFFQLYSAHLIKDKSDERRGSHACVSENWRQQHRHNTVHLNSDTNSPCALCSLRSQDPLLLGSSSFPVHRGRAPPLLNREERQVRAGCRSCFVALWSAWEGLFPSLLCRLLRHLCKAAALSLQALQTCKKSDRPVNKYGHPYLVLYVQVSEFL